MTFSLLGIGFILGLKHALDADHLAAVTTIVSRQRSISGSSRIGLLWGIGHTTTLLAAGVLVLGIDRSIPEDISHAVELIVALVLIGIGINVLRKLIKGGQIHHHIHRHGSYLHSHPHVHTNPDGVHPGTAQGHSSNERTSDSTRSGWASLLLGMLHGLAGSGTLMLLVLATIGDFWSGLLYIGIFGVGSIGGMLTMSTLVSIPFVLTHGRFHQANTIISALAGVASVAIGFTMWFETGSAAGFFG